MKRALLAVGLVAAIAVGVAAASGPSLLNPASLNATAPATFSAKFVTTRGPFVITVHRDWAPKGADRFYNLVANKFYDNQPLFRVEPGNVVQWGISMKPPIAKAWKNAFIKDDVNPKFNSKGRVTFAISGKNSRTTQVFVNLVGHMYPKSFAPFGEVASGFSVFKKLYHGPGKGGFYAQYNQPAMIKYGEWWVRKYFPKLDWIKTARLVN